MNHHAELWLGASLEAAGVPREFRTPALDVVHIVSDSLGITPVRELQQAAARQPIEASTRTFVIITSEITHEAQNALLKLLEEPPVTSRFLIVVPQERNLLPTLRSRLQLMNAGMATATHEYDGFSAASYADRLTLIAAAAKNKDTTWFEEVVAGLGAAVGVGAYDRPTLESIQFALTRYKTRGSSTKMLLELIALTVPVGRTKTK